VQTIYDWVTVAIFAGLIVLFLQRSAGDAPPKDSVVSYLLASAGCAAANYLGNHGHHFLAIAVIIAVLAFVALVLRPFDSAR
jgi:hypothetical protein